MEVNSEIGCQNNGEHISFKGKIDDVRIYNRALSASDVAQLHASEAAPARRMGISTGIMPPPLPSVLTEPFMSVQEKSSMPSMATGVKLWEFKREIVILFSYSDGTFTWVT